MPVIHPSSVVSSNTILADDCQIGPGCVIEGPVTIGKGSRLVASVHVFGPATLGEGSILYPNVCIGMPPQDFKFTLGMPTAGVRIGTGSVLREGVTVHASTKPDVPTSIGDRVLMMANSHAGHDVKVGNDVVLANGALLAGHSQVGDRANISGNVAIHQFNRVGRLAFVSGGSVMSMDIPPFCIGWARNRIAGVNLVGMRRSGMPREHITAVRQAFTRILRNPMPKSEMVAKLRELGHDCPPVLELADFVETAKRVAPGFGRLTHDELALWRAFQRGHLIASVEEESME